MPLRDHDLFYWPDSFREHVGMKGATSCLVVGVAGPELRATIEASMEDSRAVEASRLSARFLKRGTYLVDHAGVWTFLVVVAGDEAVAHAASSREVDGGHLEFAQAFVEQEWLTASPVASEAGFAIGDVVQIIGNDRIGRVSRVEPRANGMRYEVMVDGIPNRVLESSLERVEGDPTDPGFWLTKPPAGAADLATTLTWTKLIHPLTDTLYSFASSKTVFRAYQFKPVLKLLTSPVSRLLIADEVGLGKTIEAGLIWNELDQREPVRRALVVSPSSLTLKWQAEMSRRFDRELKPIRAADLLEFAAAVRAGQDPPLQGVISIEALRVASTALAELTELHPQFDLVIVDEAHNLRNRSTKSFALGRLLADWADSLIFLSATPINLHNDDLFNLLNLLDEEHFIDKPTFEEQLEPNIILNDLMKRVSSGERLDNDALKERLDALVETNFGKSLVNRHEYKSLRRTLTTTTRMSAPQVSTVRAEIAELNTLSMVLNRTRKAEVPDTRATRVPSNVDVIWTEEERAFYDAVYADAQARAAKGSIPGFAMQMPLRQAASCIPAMKAHLREKRRHVTEDVDDVDEVDGELTDVAPGTVSLRDLAVDSKFEQLLIRLTAARDAGLEQFMIFSFFRRTLTYLEERLSRQFSVRVMHGGVPTDERQRIMLDFRAGKFEVLLLSEVGSEGLDFEFCNVLVNYDMPWNPMRVEQRIGRLDRFGQKHEKIFIFNMRVPGTIEADIFTRLYDRIRIFEGSVGELEPILRDQLAEALPLFRLARTSVEQQHEVDRVAVALETRARDTALIDQSHDVLSGVDGMLIEGLTERGPRGGKFIGPSELEALLQGLVTRHGGRVSAPKQGTQVRSLRGTSSLAHALRSLRVQSAGSKYSQSHLAMMLQDQIPVDVTLDAETASRSDLELVTVRHPLIRLAIKELSDDPTRLRRFGAMSITGVPRGRLFLVSFDIAQSGGLRPRLELWTTAADLSTGQIVDDLGDLILEALAAGTIGDLEQRTLPNGIQQTWSELQDAVASRQGEEERLRRTENTALTDARLSAHEFSNRRKIDRTFNLIETLRADGRDRSIIRMHEGRIRALQGRHAEIADQLDAKRRLSLTVRPVAIAVVGGA